MLEEDATAFDYDDVYETLKAPAEKKEVAVAHKAHVTTPSLEAPSEAADVELREMAPTPTAVKQKKPKPKRKKAQVKPAPATTTWRASLLEGAAVLVLGLLLTVVEMNGPAIRFPVHGTKATGAGGIVRRPPPLAPASFEELVSFDGCLEHGAADGSGDGIGVEGCGVGSGVGPHEGANVGVSVGPNVGTGVGRSVGPAVGTGVGSAEGFGVGFADGSSTVG